MPPLMSTSGYPLDTHDLEPLYPISIIGEDKWKIAVLLLQRGEEVIVSPSQSDIFAGKSLNAALSVLSRFVLKQGLQPGVWSARPLQSSLR